MQNDRRWMCVDDLAHAIEIDLRRGFVEAVRGADRRSEGIDSGLLQELDALVQRYQVAFVVAAHAVFYALTASSSPSTAAPTFRAIATTSLVCRRLSS